MKGVLFLSIAVVLFQKSFAQPSDKDSVYLRYVNSIKISTDDFNKLLPAIVEPGKNEQEKLTLVYFWVYSHITFDIDRFLKTGPLQPLDITETLKSGKGMCYEYNEFIETACKYLKIPGYSIEGYIKYYGFEPGQTFTQNNHIWYAAYIDGNWKMIDLLWACGTLSINGDNYTFRKRLHKEYFLADPRDFLDSHLPADPVWQLQSKPLTMSGFTLKKNKIDSTQRGMYINYADTIKAMNKLNRRDKELKSGIRAYRFNPQNPNQLIVIYYNDAVDLVDNAKATKAELIKAKTYFIQSKLLIGTSKDPDMQALSPVCEKGIKSIEKRLKY